jgi:hypothetical protein
MPDSNMGAMDKERIDERAEIVQHVLVEMRSLLNSLEQATVSEDEKWFRNLLCGLLKSALIDHEFLKHGVEGNSPSLAAWASRNLLELKTITTYVLISKETATDFRNDALVDAKEMYEALTSYTKAAHDQLLSELKEMAEEDQSPHKELWREAHKKEAERGAKTEESEAEVQAIKQVMSEYGLKGDQIPKRSGQIAKKLNEQRFLPLFKVCSKILHRTALSIAAANDSSGLVPIIPFFVSTGFSDFVAIYSLVNFHYSKHGVRPPQT